MEEIHRASRTSRYFFIGMNGACLGVEHESQEDAVCLEQAKLMTGSTTSSSQKRNLSPPLMATYYPAF